MKIKNIRKTCRVCGAPILPKSIFTPMKIYCSKKCCVKAYRGRHPDRCRAATIKWAIENRERSNEIKRRSKLRKRAIHAHNKPSAAEA
jgi:hypothetical protein